MVAAAANVRVAVTGIVSTAPAGTTLPTTVSAALAAAFVDVGYISEDGISFATATDQTEIKAWQNGDTVRNLQTSHNFEASFAILETNEKALEVYFGNFTHGAGATDGVAQVRGGTTYRGPWVFDVVDGVERMRIVVPDGQVTGREDLTFANGDAIGYGITLTCYPDASSVKAYIYTQTAAAS